MTGMQTFKMHQVSGINPHEHYYMKVELLNKIYHFDIKREG